MYVYAGLAAAYATSLTFSIDGEVVGGYNGTVSNAAYSYNNLLYSTESLTQDLHTLRIINGQTNEGIIIRSLLLLDYIQFG